MTDETPTQTAVTISDLLQDAVPDYMSVQRAVLATKFMRHPQYEVWMDMTQLASIIQQIGAYVTVARDGANYLHINGAQYHQGEPFSWHTLLDDAQERVAILNSVLMAALDNCDIAQRFRYHILGIEPCYIPDYLLERPLPDWMFHIANDARMRVQGRARDVFGQAALPPMYRNPNYNPDISDEPAYVGVYASRMPLDAHDLGFAVAQSTPLQLRLDTRENYPN